ncbi:MAG: U4/U6.U5 tri-snRNP-associated protein 1 [Marteilia pararefringens]
MNEDVLVNVNMIDNEKHLENVLKKKSVTGNGYNPYADDGTETKEDILSKYNEEIDGKTIKSFKIGETFENFDTPDREDQTVKIKRNLQSLEEDMISPPSDYFSKAELSLKKRKSSTIKPRKLKKSAEEVINRERKINVDELSSHTDIDRARPVIKIIDESNFEPQSNVIDKISQMKQLEKENTEESDFALNGENKLELDLNHEFVLNLDVDKEKQKAMSNVRDDDKKDQMSLKDLKDQNAESILFNQHIANDNQSISSVIMFAKNQGLIDKQMQNIKYSEENKQIADNIKSKKFEKVEKNTDDALQLKFPSSSSRMRYQTVDFNDKSQYNPNISLQYFDEGGREVNNKEAFKILSHKFHGKWPGKKKEEKRMRKLAGQHLTAFSSLTDTPLHTVDKMRKKLESTKEPCIFLSKRHK